MLVIKAVFMQKKRRFIYLLTNSLYFVWSILLVSILAIIVGKVYSYSKYVATQQAITSANKDIAYRSWVASHGGVYVPVDKRTPPNPYLSHIKNRDFRAIGKEFTLMNPAYTLSQMMHDYSKLYGIKTHITSKNLLNPKNKPDDWETVALEKIDETRKSFIELSKIGSQEYMRLMKPLVTKKICLKCHAQQGYKIGDIRGGVSVAIPMKKFYVHALNNSVLVSILFLLIWMVGIFSIKFFSKKIYKYLDEKEESYERYIYGLVNVIEKRDTYTAGHSTRVANYAQIIARDMGFSDNDCEMIHRAGMLHDIGKVAIPDSIFLKPTTLSDREYKLIQEHVNISYEMLKDIAIFDDIKEIVRDHHERYDGAGYPRGLSSQETPILAQVLTLADAFDAMTTDRIYKGRKSVKEAIQEIAKQSGKQFNPKIVNVAIKSLKNSVIEHNKHQAPKTVLEQERFSYFYKDPLTHLYNEAYLHKDIQNLNSCNFLVWISLKEFHNFNRSNGWKSGDKVLQNLSDVIHFKCKNHISSYRFYGDNFLILLDNIEEVKRLKEYVQEVLNQYEIKFDIKVSNNTDVQVCENENLDEILDKFF